MDKDIQVVERPAEIDTLDFLNTELGDETSPLIPNQEKEEVEAKAPEGEEIEIPEKEEVNEDEINFEPFKISEVKKKYPELFKEFPQLKNLIYRGEAYEEVFPTIATAKVAKERVEVLEAAEKALFAGKVDDILKSVKNQDEEAFKRVVDNFLPTINNIDRGSYLQVMGNIGKFFIQNMVTEANRFGRESEQGKILGGAALTLNQFLFGNSVLEPIKPLAKPVSEDDNKIQQREAELNEQRFSEIRDDLVEKMTNTITATINKYIDPRSSMPTYVRDTAIERVKRALDAAIISDEKFRSNQDKLWQYLIESNFSKQAQDAVKNSYYGKAKSLLGEIIRKERADALAGLKTTGNKKEPVDTSEEDKKYRAKPAASKSSNEDGPRRGESTAAWINRTMGT